MKKLSLLLVLGLLGFACTEGNKENGSGRTTFQVFLTDSPGEYEEVLIDIQEVKINVSSEDDEEGWRTLDNVNVGIYNLLDFTNGIDTLLASEEIPSGKISQMRLVLGPNNSIKKEGEYHELKTPSAQQSGLKLNIHATLVEDIDYRIWLDFDASRSIVEKGNGTYSLKPVIRTYTEATSGGIEGLISPVEARPYVMVISALNDTVGTLADTVSGEFLVKGLEAGTYKVEFEPISDFLSKEIEDVSVTLGNITDMGTVILEADSE